MKITLVNSHDGVKWKQHLAWLMDEHPGVVRKLFRQKKLVDYLDTFVANVVAYRGGIQRRGTSRRDAEIEIATGLLADVMSPAARTCSVGYRKPPGDNDPLTEHEVQELSDFLAELEPNETTVEV